MHITSIPTRSSRGPAKSSASSSLGRSPACISSSPRRCPRGGAPARWSAPPAQALDDSTFKSPSTPRIRRPRPGSRVDRSTSQCATLDAYGDHWSARAPATRVGGSSARRAWRDHWCHRSRAFGGGSQCSVNRVGCLGVGRLEPRSACSSAIDGTAGTGPRLQIDV